jgi:tRNA modification GTPase
MLKEDVKMGEAHFSLIDTAGIRDSQDGIEQEGIKRSYAASKAADLILYVIDASCELTDEEKKRIESLPIDKTILIYNKVDLCHPKIPFPLFSTCVLSAKTLDGVEKLKSIIEEKIFAGTLHDKGEVVITQKRHQEALSDAIVNLETVICGLNSGVSAEFISFDLKMSLKALGMIIGFDLSESVLDAIFSKFCVGK